MENYGPILKLLTATAVCCLGLLMILAVGCKKEPGESTPAATLQPAAQFANVRCPIMGTQMDLANVPETLTRTHKGQKVAFCCAKCPAAWDKLSDTERDAKLTMVARKGSD